ncbi:glycosyltransferase [unidentified bacterial endosymbiont]|uniref:glycosyltransferase n=1 Tax=unidentified bacterial endosymbiont TaxID=2355 RepID=UPI00209EAF1D|nr:glycosyltransferase [unidentified bacterial endosymbiont]
MVDNTIIQHISVVIPLYNESQSLPELLDRTQRACESLQLPYEIILVDDGSRDASPELISTAAREAAGTIVAVLLNRNYGQHAAIMAGFEQSRGEIVITLDADLQNPPEAIPQLVQAAQQGYEVVGTLRIGRQDPGVRKFFSKLVNWMTQKVTGQVMSDYGCMLRAYRRPIVEAMLNCPERSTFIPILANSFARHTTELPVEHRERQHGESKYNFWQLVNLSFDLVTCMTTLPLRCLSILGSVIALSGFLLSLLLVILRVICGPIWAANGVFTLFAVLFSFMGVQLMGLGLLGEYIGRIYNEVRGRPRYFIQQVIRQQDSEAGEP